MRKRSSAAKSALPSRHVTEGMHNALNRIYFHAMGLERADIDGPLIGIASAWDSESAAGDAPLRCARTVEQGIWAAGATPRQFATISAGDGATHLLTRELVADSVELTMRGHSYDALVGITACPLAMAGFLLAMARLDVPSVLVPLAEDPVAEAARVLRLAASCHLEAGSQIVARLEQDATARTFVTEERLRAAAAEVPGALVHLAALAHECGLELTLEDLAGSAWLTGSLGGGLFTGDGATKLTGRASVFDDEASACGWIERGASNGTVLVVRGQGPSGAPGMPLLARLAAAAPGLVAVVTDARLPPIDGVACVSAVTPEAAAGGPIAALADGDGVTIDAAAGTLDAATTGDGYAPRLASTASLRKYARTVQPAITGAVTHPGAAGEWVRYADL